VAAIHVAGVRCDPCGAMQRICTLLKSLNYL